MQDKPVVFVVGSQCAPELEEKFNNWYNETHIPLLLKSKWIAGVTRYRLSPVVEGEHPKYLSILEFKDRQAFEAWDSSTETRAARDEMKETWGDEGFEIKWRAVYEPIKTWYR